MKMLKTLSCGRDEGRVVCKMLIKCFTLDLEAYLKERFKVYLVERLNPQILKEEVCLFAT